jgi:hypothetical protein
MDAGLSNKLVAWCVLYGGGMAFIAGRLFARWYIYGRFAPDDWLMVAAAVAYTGCMITEIFIYLSFKAADITAYIAVRPWISKWSHPTMLTRIV